MCDFAPEATASAVLLRSSIEELAYLLRARQKRTDHGFADAMAPIDELIKREDPEVKFYFSRQCAHTRSAHACTLNSHVVCASSRWRACSQ